MLKYRPEIDGLRALAVLAVILFHAGIATPGGYVGVDVFFVISGFLITKILAGDFAANQLSLAAFWERRIRRIVPAAVAVTVVVLGAAFFLFTAADFKGVGKSVVAAQFAASNVFFWRDIGYFSSDAELKPMLHTWSLAVEEQFYLLYPTLLCLSLRWVTREVALQWWKRLLIFSGALSFVLCVYGGDLDRSAAFYLLPTRVWELAAGCLLALYDPAPLRTRLGNELVGLAGLGCIVASMQFFTIRTTFPGTAALLPVGGAVAVIWASADRRTLAARLLVAKPLVGIGLISYSLYLWHWPLLAFARYGFGSHLSHAQLGWILLLTFGCAALSYHFIEKPFRKKNLLSRRFILTGGLASAGLMAGVAIALVAIGKSAAAKATPLEQQLARDADWNGSEFETRSINDRFTQFARLGAAQPGAPANFLLWGDSHGMVVGGLLDELARNHQVTGIAALRSGVPPIRGAWRMDRNEAEQKKDLQWNEDVWAEILRSRVKNVLLVACWSAYCGREISPATEKQSAKLLVDQPSTPQDPRGATQLLVARLARLNEDCRREGIKLWVMRQVPEHGVDGPARRMLLHQRTPWLFPEPTGFPEHEATKHRFKFEAEMADLLVASGVNVIDVMPAFFPENGSPLAGTAPPYSNYRDVSHLTYSGARRLLGNIFEQEFKLFVATPEKQN